MAIRDLAKTFPEQYTKSIEYLKRVDAYEKRLPQIREALDRRDEAGIRETGEIAAFQRKVLLSNPLSERGFLRVCEHGRCDDW